MSELDRMRAEALPGHAAIAARFDHLFHRGKIGGTYLFVGPREGRPETFAAWLAKGVLCLGAPVQPGRFGPCGRCRSCVQFDAGSHPDLDVVQKPEDRSTIPLDAFIGDADHRMRAGLCWRILLAPALSRRKVAIILDADSLTDEGANCLLKTLEEPPDASVIILVGRAIERQLPTIRSRCQTVRFRPLDPSQLPAEPPDPEADAFHKALARQLAERPVQGVRLARDVTAWVEGAGKEPSARRVRLKGVFETAIDCYRRSMRQAVGANRGGPTGMPGDDEFAASRLAATLEAIELVDANLNVSMLVEAWTARLEDPGLSQAAMPSFFA